MKWKIFRERERERERWKWRKEEKIKDVKVWSFVEKLALVSPHEKWFLR